MDLSEKTADETYRHPWELSRTDMILNSLDDLDIHGDVLDIGCGDGFFDDMLLERFDEVNSLWGIDIFAENSFHDGKKHMIHSYEELDNKKFDYILMMDVLEHIEDDADFLKSIKKYMKEDTVLFITVPAFQSLFSLHDKELYHFRRYNAKELETVLNKAGFAIEKKSYFYLSLIFMRLLTMNKTENLSMWESPESSFKTRIIRKCLNLDFKVLSSISKLKLYLPGLSLMAVSKLKD